MKEKKEQFSPRDLMKEKKKNSCYLVI